VTVNSIVSAISALSLNELNHNKQQNSLLWAQHDDGLVIPQLYEGIKEPALKREGNCQSEYRHSSCD
jgi:hypothetical protein